MRTAIKASIRAKSSDGSTTPATSGCWPMTGRSTTCGGAYCSGIRRRHPSRLSGARQPERRHDLALRGLPAVGTAAATTAPSPRGRQIYQNVCAISQDFNGLARITGDVEGLNSLAASTQVNPRRAPHKIMNGQTYADMPALSVFGPETVRDALSYAQSLPREQQ